MFKDKFQWYFLGIGFSYEFEGQNLKFWNVVFVKIMAWG
jgi:hypothetical protein